MTKASVLNYLNNRVTLSIIPNFKILTNTENVKTDNLNYPLIIRSSASDEDLKGNTKAGFYKSYICNEESELSNAIESTFSQYTSTHNEVIVQEYLQNADYYGIIFTADINTGAPYFIINESKYPCNATDGKKINTHVCCKGFTSDVIRLQSIINMAKEIELILCKEGLDIEFAIKDNKIYLLQARPLSKHLSIDLYSIINDTQLDSSYSVMSDWNPAEIIGICPKPLGLSLYEKVLMNKAWAIKREQFGYSKSTSKGMVRILGRPYIDLYQSFLTLTPNNIPTKLKEKIIRNYILKLKNNPHLHDKIEFDIVHSCYTPKFDNDQLDLSTDEKNVFKSALLNLTNNLINLDLSQDLLKIQQFSTGIKTITTWQEAINYTITNGTIPFAGFARLAFVCTSILKDLFSSNDVDKFLKSISNLPQKISNDFIVLDTDNFIKKYGHLRPGTYDVEQKNFKDNYKQYFHKPKFIKKQKDKFCLPNIDQKLKSLGYNFTTKQLSYTAKKTIALREYSKLIFTKGINLILNKLQTQFGEETSFFDLDTMTFNHEQFRLASIVNLPPLIFEKTDLFSYSIWESNPNFITKKTIISDVTDQLNDIENKIVFITNADPGYDWIFSHNISGLITSYGGANSHMAIRCHELDLPAVIGCGENNYKKWLKYQILSLDCEKKLVTGR